MQTVIERPAALDVHKASVTACVRVPSGGGVREQHVEEFAATVRGLLSLRDWLAAFGVTHVAMEASGVYWKSPWAILEDEFDCVLVNARHVKQVDPGACPRGQPAAQGTGGRGDQARLRRCGHHGQVRA